MTAASGSDAALDRALLSLHGLSVGDAFGETFFVDDPADLIANRRVPPAPWPYTDDTVMALSIVEVLRKRGAIDQDLLAERFAARYLKEPGRGYGRAAHKVLQSIAHGDPWRPAAQALFDGAGSLGNGGAMRAAPIGAYFADDPRRAADEARLSAEVTHAHAEGQAGATAVAAAAAWAWRWRRDGGAGDPSGLMDEALELTGEGETRTGIARARELPESTTVAEAAETLGCGWRVTSPDTVPLCLWLAARNLDDYEAAMWETVSALGDRDTTCAIVGGIVIAAGDWSDVPEAWARARERLAY